MQTSSTPHAAAETDAVSLQMNLLALNLAIELARAGESERGSILPTMAVRHLCELLGDEAHQMGGGEGLRRAVEELELALRQAGEASRRPAGPGEVCPEAEPMRIEGIGGR
jgi:hypothetical protein